MAEKTWRTGATVLWMLLCVSAEAAARERGVSAEEDVLPAVCPVQTASEAFVLDDRGFCPSWLSPSARDSIVDFAGVTEGEESTLHQALNIVQENKNAYVALLFYASWCPFSRACLPNFGPLSLLFPSIRHFAFEESSIRPSILSRYAVYGFPTIFLINSTMRIRYHGPRDVASLVAFYNDVTGIQLRPLDSASWQRIHLPPESCPFSWARSPERLLREDTWLALATAFVALRVAFLLAPAVLGCGRWAWQRRVYRIRLGSLWDESKEYLANLRKLGLNLHRRRNLQEGARIWAPQSLVKVSVGEPASLRRVHAGLQRN